MAQFKLEAGLLVHTQLEEHLAALQRLLPHWHPAWDAALAAASSGGSGGGAGDATASGRGSVGGSNGDDRSSLQGASPKEDDSLLAFKISRACAAAALQPGDARIALSHLRRLVPLKFRHFALREAHMARQLRELCSRTAATTGTAMPVNATRTHPQPTAVALNASMGGSGSDGAMVRNPDQRQLQQQHVARPHRDVVVVVGRQYVPGMRALWEDRASPLWRDRIKPEVFPTSYVEGPPQP